MRYELFPEENAREEYWTDEKGLIHCRRITDISDVLNANIEDKQKNSKGFTLGRNFQHLTRVPLGVFHRWAMQVGWYGMDRHARKIEHAKFMKKHPEYLVVEKPVTHSPDDKYLIIK
jgi:hypothetical protein